MGRSVDKTTKEPHAFVFARRLFKVNEFQLYSLDWNIPVSTPNELYTVPTFGAWLALW